MPEQNDTNPEVPTTLEDALMGLAKQVTFSFQIPNVPYSSVRVTATYDNDGQPDITAVVAAMQTAHAVAREFAEVEWPEPRAAWRPEADENSGYRGDEPPPHEEYGAPPPRQQGGQGGGGGQAIAYCPEHNMAPMKPSAPQYNRDGDKFYHQLDPREQYMREGRRVTSHTLYWRLTVDANGNSNQNQPIPGITGGGQRGGYGGGYGR